MDTTKMIGKCSALLVKALNILSLRFIWDAQGYKKSMDTIKELEAEEREGKNG